MDPILLLRPDLVRFRTISGYRAWGQSQSSKSADSQRRCGIISSLRRLIAALRAEREPRHAALAFNDTPSSS